MAARRERTKINAGRAAHRVNPHRTATSTPIPHKSSNLERQKAVLCSDRYDMARDIRSIASRTAGHIAAKLGIEKTALIRVALGPLYRARSRTSSPSGPRRSRRVDVSPQRLAKRVMAQYAVLGLLRLRPE
jgi:hypothetical protein